MTGRRLCEWSIDDLGGDTVWETDCNGTFQFTDGGPKDNNFRYCAYCGGELVEARTSVDAVDPDASGHRDPSTRDKC